MTHEGYTAAKCWSLAPTPSPLTMSTSKEGHLRGRKVLDLSQERQHDALALALLPEKSLGGWTFSSLEGTGQRGGGGLCPALQTSQRGQGGDRQKARKTRQWNSQLLLPRCALAHPRLPRPSPAPRLVQGLSLYVCILILLPSGLPTPRATVSASGRGSLPR